jgi:signal transduction histidine kinase/integral membrane sensor domain MASE1/DNA-binding NarL/FixJ family response regulator
MIKPLEHPLRLLTLIIILGAVYFVTGKLGISLAVPPGFATIIWPPSGISVATLIVCGFGLWPGVLLGSLLLNLHLMMLSSSETLSFLQLATAASIATGSTLQALLGAWIGKKVLGNFSQIEPLKNIKKIGILFLLCGPVICVVAPSLSVFALFMNNALAGEQILHNWLTWWMGDTFGVIVFLPLTFLIIHEIIDFHDYRTGKKPISSLAIITVIIPLISTLFAWDYSSTYIYQKNLQQFSNLAEENRKALEYRMESYSHILLGGAGFFSGSQNVSRSEWGAFSDMVDVTRNFPGVSGIGYIESVPKGNLDIFLNKVRQDGFSNFNISPPGEHPDHFIITYIEPIETNRTAIGLNIAFEKNRYEAAIRARDTGRTTITRHVTLVQDKKKSPGFLLLHPLYENRNKTQSQNTENFKGWIYIPFVARNFFTNLTNSQEKTLNIRVYDNDQLTPESLIYDSAEYMATQEIGKKLFNEKKTINIMQKDWTIEWVSTGLFEKNVSNLTPEIILFSGLIFTALYAIFLFSLTERAKIVESLVREKTREAEKEKENALKASAAKAAFLAQMSHEIRTPMNGILGFMDMLGKTQLDKNQQTYLEKSTAAGNILLSIIADILDLSRIEAGKLILENAPFNFRESLNTCLELVKADAAQKGLDLQVNIDNSCPEFLIGDKLRLMQIFINLLSNAVKFTDTGFIRLEASYNQKILTANIKDTGIGIDPKSINIIFESFVQADSGISRKYGGAGLGLSIIKRILDAMNGEISIASEKDKGSTFTFNVPLEKIDNLPTISGPSKTLAPGKYHILVVEDAKLNQDLLIAMLERTGHHATLAKNGVEAIDRAKQKKFDLILMDIQMHVMDGMEATRIIRNELKLKTPIIAITAHAFPEDIGSFFEAGIDDYVIKPFTSAEIDKAIDNILHGELWGEVAYVQTSRIFNTERVNEFFGILGKEKSLIVIYDFLKEADNKICYLSEINQDRSHISREFHSLASTVGNIGFEKMAEECRTLNREALTLTEENLKEKMTILQDIYKESCQHLHNFIHAMDR